MRDRKQIGVSGVFLALSVTVAAGQEVPELVTDRPDQTESSLVVPEGSVQLETGWTWSDDGAATVSEGPGTLARIGIHDRFELRLGWGGWVDEGGPGGRGAGDAELGGKIHLAAEAGRRPETALLFGVSVPVGDDRFTSDRYDPAFRFSFSHSLRGDLGLGYNVGVEWASERAGGATLTRSSAIYTVALGFPLSGPWSGFVEVFGSEPLEGGGAAAHAVDGGVTRLLGPDLQLDLALGTRIQGDAPDGFVGIGITRRWR